MRRLSLFWCAFWIGCTGPAPEGDGSNAPDVEELPTVVGDIAVTGPLGEVPDVTMHVDAECGTGVALGAVEGLRRWPYLQNVRQTSAVVAWGVEAGSEEAALRMYEPGKQDAAIRVVASRRSLAVSTPFDLVDARLANLRPGTTYCYALDSGKTELAGARSFTTAPSDQEAAVKFFVLGDFGNSYPAQKQVRDQMDLAKEGVEFWVTTGDNAYSSGTYDQFEEHVFGIYPEMLGLIPIYPTPGNHDWGMGNLDAYLDNFFLPENALAEADRESYYSFDYGPLHFLMLDSERGKLAISDERLDDMRDFAVADLQGVSRPWKIAVFHHPIISGMPGRESDVLMADNFSSLFEEHGVQLVLAGHNHMYERFVPLKSGVPASDGITYVTTGGGGASLYGAGTNKNLVAVESVNHFMVVEADACELRARAIDSSGKEIDTFTLSQC